jgi:hypothetical protein
MNCSVAAWIISSASPEWIRRVRATISVPISATEIAAVAIHSARYPKLLAAGSGSQRLWNRAEMMARTPVAATVIGP